GRTWRWRRMRRYSELSRGAERSSPRQFFPDCTIAMRGYNFREGQVVRLVRPGATFLRNYAPHIAAMKLFVVPSHCWLGGSRPGSMSQVTRQQSGSHDK